MSKIARQPDYIPKNQPSANMPFLTLSIFILLLAFFVVLNTNSDFEIKKASPVLESLEKQFAKKFWGPAKYSTENSDKDKNIGEGSAKEILERLFASSSISFELKKIDDSGNFVILLKKNDFKRALSQVTKGLKIQGHTQKGKVFENYLNIFTQISIMTSNANSNNNYIMSVFIYKTNSNKNAEELTNYKDMLIKTGVNKNSLAFGIKEKNTKKINMVELYFTR